MNLKYYIDKKGKKIYTLKDKIPGKTILDAHHKFIKIRNAAETDQ